jgi:hypothetical protein
VPARRGLLISLLLISSVAAAKKLYKYQDQQGRWYFSDDPPVTEQTVEIRQLMPADKHRVWLEQAGSKTNPDFMPSIAIPVRSKLPSIGGGMTVSWLIRHCLGASWLIRGNQTVCFRFMP